jgi:hypothetical protein
VQGKNPDINVIIFDSWVLVFAKFQGSNCDTELSVGLKSTYV